MADRDPSIMNAAARIGAAELIDEELRQMGVRRH